jgi:hypothetical protein
MSRARPVAGLWFDRQRGNEKATAIQLETLAEIEGITLDDLLDEGLTQAQVLERLREALHGQVIPQEVLDARRRAKELAKTADTCRICSALGTECEGSITRHHFVCRWLMLELENYQSYAARSKCCIPICVGRHRDLHIRGDKATPKSIVQFMRPDEAELAQRMLNDLKEQKPALFDLILGGDEESYEYQLVRDYKLGLFVEKSRESAVSASSNSSQATA